MGTEESERNRITANDMMKVAIKFYEIGYNHCESGKKKLSKTELQMNILANGMVDEGKSETP